MKKFTDSSKMLSAKLKKYLKRAGIAVVVVAVGVATYITVSTDDSMVSSDGKLVSVATVEENSVSDAPVEYAKSEFEEMQEAKAEEKLSKVERSEKRAAALALAEDTEEATEKVAETDTEQEAETEAAEVTTTELVFVPTEAPTTEKSTDGLPNEDVKQEATTEKSKNTTEATTSKSTDGLPDEEVKYDDEQGTYLGTYLLTAYCPCEICCGQWSNTENPVTASGNPAVEGVTIAAPSEFAFGTELVINGHTYVVQDRGGAITGNHLDVYFSTHEKALNFAMGYYDVYMK